METVAGILTYTVPGIITPFVVQYLKAKFGIENPVPKFFVVLLVAIVLAIVAGWMYIPDFSFVMHFKVLCQMSVVATVEAIFGKVVYKGYQERKSNGGNGSTQIGGNVGP